MIDTEKDIISTQLNFIRPTERLIMRDLIDTSDDLLSVKDTHGNYVLANAALASMFGTTPKNMIGTTEHLYNLPEIADKHWNEECDVIRTGISRDNIEEVYAGGRDHKIRYLSVFKKPWLDFRKRIIGVVIIGHDITIKQLSWERYHSLFYESSAPTWEQDMSEVIHSLNSITKNISTTLSAYLSEHPTLVLELAKDIRTLRINDAALQLYGFTNSEEYFKYNHTIFIESSVSGLIDSFDAIMAHKTYGTYSTKHKTISGKIVHLNMKWSVVKGYEDTYQRVIITAIDITIVKEHEALLQDLNSNLQQIGIITAIKNEETIQQTHNLIRWIIQGLETTDSGITITNESGNIIYINRADVKMHKYDNYVELIGQPSKILAPERLHRNNIRANGKQFEYPIYQRETINITKDGREFPVFIISNPIYNDKCEFIGRVSICNDISEKKRIEQWISSLEEQHIYDQHVINTIIDYSPDFIYIKDCNSKFIIANKSLTEYMCYMTTNNTDSIIGKTDFDFYPADIAEKYFQEEQRIIRFNKGFYDKIEYHYSVKDNSQMYMLASKIPLYDRNQQLIGIIGFTKNVTHLKIKEYQLQQLNQQLFKAQELAGIGTWIHNVNELLPQWSEGLFRIFELDSQNGVPPTLEQFLQLIHESKRSELSHAIDQNLKHHIGYNMEVDVIARNSLKKIILKTDCISSTDKLFPNYTIGIAKDITEQRKLEHDLLEREKQYRQFFEESPIAVWEEDLSKVREYLLTLKSENVIDMQTYLEEHPDCVNYCASLIKTNTINNAVVKLYKAKNKEDYLANSYRIFTEKSLPGLIIGCVSIFNNEFKSCYDAINLDFDGNLLYLNMQWVVISHEMSSYKKVLITAIDMTEYRVLFEDHEDLKRAYQNSAQKMTLFLENLNRNRELL